ncbi:tripartite motif-containing protein 16-like protein [Pseudorasbora parva]|uniref:tripartite motif-containing protein 16-like protein n=1 Tax=Pseudorasbora parva TaxID=51549 RepID=UPI00351F18BE
MAEARNSLDEFKCPVCLDLLKDPVTIPCGHSYCRSCITSCWDQKRVYSCPECRKTFSPIPALAKNTMLAEVVKKLEKTELSADCYTGAGAEDVMCDVSTGRKHKAVKSCLVCLKSYCQTHFDSHEEFHSHKVTDATGLQHKLKEMQRSIQLRIQQKEKDLQQLREDVEFHMRSAQTAVEDSERIFTELIYSIERSRSETTQRIRDQEKTAVSRAEGQLERLEQEINDLRRRDAELEQLSHTQDHIHVLQSFPSLSAFPESTDVNDNPFSSLSSFDCVRESVRLLRDKLDDFCKEELKKISDRVMFTNIVPRTRNNFLQYSHSQLTLDLNTVNKLLRLSESDRVITYSCTVQPYPDHPDRFDGYNPQVLCRESVCGRCYWEIEWRGDDVSISVSYKSIRRKGRGKKCVFGYNNQSWSLSCFSSPVSYSFIHNDLETDLTIEPISSRIDHYRVGVYDDIYRIGVYVDHSAGILSFYSVSGETMSLIHTVQTTFTQPLYPGFCVEHGSSVRLC